MNLVKSKRGRSVPPRSGNAMKSKVSKNNGKRGGVKIGYLLRMYPRFTQTFVANEILELERQGADISIISLRLPNEGIFHESCSQVKARASYVPQNLQGGRIEALQTQWKLLKRSRDLFRRIRSLWARHKGVEWQHVLQAMHVVRWAKRNHISRLHVHFGTEEATVAMLANMLGSIPYSLTLHAFDIFRANVDKALLAKKINASQFVITVSEYNRRYMVEHLPNLCAEKIRVNYNGVDLDKFSCNGQEREAMSIFSVGRLIEKKGFVHLIRAVKRLRDQGLPVACHIAGEGREQKKLEREIKELDLSDCVTLLGRVRQSEVGDWLKRAGCFALPCVHAEDGNVDALPTVLLESLASGCPTVSTRVSGVPEIIDHGEQGFLVEPGDDESLAKAIHEVLADGDVAATFSAAGRRRAADRFDIRKNAAVMHGWLHDKTKDAQPKDTPGQACALPVATKIGETAPCQAGS